MSLRLAGLAVLGTAFWVTTGAVADPAEASSAVADSESGLRWDVGAQLGGASFFGAGSDAIEIGSVATVEAGVRFHEHLGLHAILLLVHLPLRADEAGQHQGDFVAGALAPAFYPLQRTRQLELSIAPTWGYSYLSGDIEGSMADVAYKSRGAVAGVALGAMWTVQGRLAVGASVMLLHLLADRACVRLDRSTTSCGARGGLGTQMGAVQVGFRASL